MALATKVFGTESVDRLVISRCRGDIDSDGEVGIDDFLLVLACWGLDPALCQADLDGDGEIGIDDFLILLADWGPCP